MKLPPDVEFHEDIRLLVYRPRGLVNKAAVNKIISVVGELETTLQEPFNRFSDTVAADAVDLNFEHIIRVSLYRRLFYVNRPPIKSAILATDGTLIHYGKVHALLTQGSPINVRVFQDRKEAAKWLGVPIELLVAKASGGSGGQPQKPNMKTKHPRHRLFLLEAISQNCNAVATALCRRAPVGNSIEAPRHSEATATFIRPSCLCCGRWLGASHFGHADRSVRRCDSTRTRGRSGYR